MIEALYPLMMLIHVFLDNARYHHAKLVQEWLARPGCRIRLHFIPTYCPHLNPIERLWGLMHRNVTHNKCYATCAQFADATLGFLREKVPRNWADLCDSVTDNFRVIKPGFSGNDVNGVYHASAKERTILLRCESLEPPMSELGRRARGRKPDGPRCARLFT